MADQDDLSALQRGEHDLVRRDFRSADLRQQNFKGADLSQAHFEYANLERADLSHCRLVQAQTLGMNASGAIFAHADISQTVFVNVNLTGADMRRSNFSGSHFQGSNLSGADIRGANFRSAVLNEGTTFEGCLADETTLFDNASVFRPLARQAAFRFYDVDRGRLIRKSDESIRALTSSTAESRLESPPTAPSASPILDAEIERLVAAIDAALQGLSQVPVPTTDSVDASTPGIGHNNPPPETPIGRQEYHELVSLLEDVRGEVQKGVPVEEPLAQASSRISTIVGKTVAWGAHKLDVAAEEFAKAAGKSLGSTPNLVAIWLVAAGKLGEVVDLVSALLTRLFH